jgi:hypothetical protein
MNLPEIETLENPPKTLKFGDKIRFTVSPGIILAIQESLEAWLIKLSEQGDIESDRETFGQTQEIIRLLFENSINDKPLTTDEQPLPSQLESDRR